MSLREWLIAIGTLVILGIIIDGIRRVRRARKESMAISSGMGADDLQESPLDEEYNPELPNGGARTVSRETLEERGYVKSSGRSRFANPEPKPTRPVIAAGGSMADQERAAVTGAPQADSLPVADDRQDESHDDWQEEVAPRRPAGQADDMNSDSGWGALDDDPELDAGFAGESRATLRPLEVAPDQPAAQPVADNVPPLVTADVQQDTARRERPETKAASEPLAGANRPEAQEVVVINVLAKREREFQGAALKKLFEACGLEYGDMDIYHRHEQVVTTSPVQFSVANAVEPGTFRPADMPALSTPGISFFMSLPGPSNAMQAFDFMLETAQCVVKNLGGELKDERRSVMTPQTIEHCRQRIREFERKQRSRRPG
ncbi:cell division protein ZipA [Marinobacter sp.]|uniref:cell division protein ZipA n=1 Tax=Marinobacter sp. TaxID=50741 RepID=UPI0019CCB3B7|nr:cell division protein ZipA [Marinobacter sp.]MBD3655627.1 cell division protein ZipA [Marinobacter sp.]